MILYNSDFGFEHAPHFALLFALCVARALDGAAGGGQEKGRLSFGLRGLRGICVPGIRTPSAEKIYKTFWFGKMPLFAEFLRLNFCTCCEPPARSLFGPAGLCLPNPTPDA